MCGGCHIFQAHVDPIEFHQFIIKRIGKDRYDRLRAISQMVKKVDAVRYQVDVPGRRNGNVHIQLKEMTGRYQIVYNKAIVPVMKEERNDSGERVKR